MKNQFYLLLLCAVVTLMGCQPDPLEIQPQETEIERSSERKRKVQICHCTGNNNHWKVIKVSKQAVRAHMRHGDYRMKDKDRDGFYQANPCVPANEVDCDDNNKYVNPACPENPNNGIDDNCDGVIDEGGVQDADGDGYNADEDCNDNDPAINPGATEICDGIDNNCDGAIDEGIPTSTFYLDADGDGFGDDGETVDACAAPDGYVAVGGDCDDADPTVNETCTSCPIISLLNLENITPVAGSAFVEEPSGIPGFGFVIRTQTTDEAGNILTAELGVIITTLNGGEFGYGGDAYANDGTYIDYGGSPQVPPTFTFGNFSEEGQLELCTQLLIDFVSNTTGS